MAYSLKITAKLTDEQEVRIELPWWNINELKKTYKFRQEWVYGCYMDYILEVDKRTFSDIIISQEKHRNKGVFEYEGWIVTNNKKKAELDDLLEKLRENENVVITIFEWESGMG
jgi:hypothetical protein